MKAAARRLRRPRPRRTRDAPQRAPEILARLRVAYPEARCALEHRNAFELLCATILSAQCTDARVNLVTPTLFAAYPTPEALGRACEPARSQERGSYFAFFWSQVCISLISRC